MIDRLRFAVLGAGASLALGLAACGNGAPGGGSSGGTSGGGNCPGTASATASGAADVKVDANDQLQFSPTSATAKVGQAVLWNNVGTVLHNITFDKGCLTDAQFQPGGTWTIKFTQPGTYSYKCTIHPGMDGKLTVS